MDKKPLEPGCLAIIIKSSLGASIGKIVECIQIEFGGVRHPDHGIIWLVQSQTANLVDEMGGKSDTFHVPADWLVRIPDDPLPDEEDDVELPQDELALEDA